MTEPKGRQNLTKRCSVSLQNSTNQRDSTDINDGTSTSVAKKPLIIGPEMWYVFDSS